MKKRDFLTASAFASVMPMAQATPLKTSQDGPVLLTVSGDIGKSNRGPLDPALDQMMVKQGIVFEKAMVFDASTLYRMPSVQIQPTLEYDAKVHTLSGPLISTVLSAAGVALTKPLSIVLRAVDGYNVAVSLADLQTYRMVLATHMDGRPLALGGLGPLWAVLDADRVAPFKDKPLKERFALCPWGLYHIGVLSKQ
jgi:hypothetical protein